MDVAVLIGRNVKLLPKIPVCISTGSSPTPSLQTVTGLVVELWSMGTKNSRLVTSCQWEFRLGCIMQDSLIQSVTSLTEQVYSYFQKKKQDTDLNAGSYLNKFIHSRLYFLFFYILLTSLMSYWSPFLRLALNFRRDQWVWRRGSWMGAGVPPLPDGNVVSCNWYSCWKNVGWWTKGAMRRWLLGSVQCDNPNILSRSRWGHRYATQVIHRTGRVSLVQRWRWMEFKVSSRSHGNVAKTKVCNEEGEFIYASC